MKLLRIWVPDPSSPEFAKETERQAKLLRGHPSEKEALDFIEAAFEGGAIGGLAMTAYRNCKVSGVQEVIADAADVGVGYGFSILSQGGLPLCSLSFATRENAEERKARS